MKARYTRWFTSIWSDPDFTALSRAAQGCYFMLGTQPDLSHCGVLPLTMHRWARLAPDTDTESVRAALEELQTNRFVLIDHATEELLIRTFVKHDEQWRNPNGIKAIETARSRVVSVCLAAVIAATVQALTEGAYEGAYEGACEGDASPLQPAASSQQPTTYNQQQQQPDFRANSNDATQHPDAAAAAVIELVIATRKHQTAGTIRNPNRWETTMRRNITLEHTETITARLNQNNDPIDIVATITGAHRNDIIRAQAGGAQL